MITAAARAARTLSPVAALVALAIMATPAQAATAVSPVNDAIAPGLPTLSWTLDPGEQLAGVEMSPTTAVDATGRYSHADRRFLDNLTTASTSGALTGTQLYAGRWYWHVAGDLGAGAVWGPMATFKVAPKVKVNKITGKSYKKKRGVKGFIYLTSNAKTVGLRVKVFFGKTRCMNKTLNFPNQDIGVKQGFTYNCLWSRAFKSGTPIKVVVTAHGNGVTSAKTFKTRF